MTIIEIIILAIGLSMDAFATSVCKGITIKKKDRKSGLIIGLYFGIAHMIMPVIGFLLGSSFEKTITKLDHWVAFILLLLIGAKMIIEAYSKKKNVSDNNDFINMLPLTLSISIDALAVGISFAFLNINIIKAVLIIGIITFILSFIGIKIGQQFGRKFEHKSQLVGGIILILIGLKILLEHLNVF